ncbi:hypothetical protein N7520_003891 [Penicillium odoratum]|uniref:uncharacterized protein n=1 Tax=Penicillium odoratum TaxID=1167516 RepID=UPI002548ED05|nr:uncharacterized protein N7520_003891 [Penicillium odoratum]KAJ5769332.1 hypothetical protein N7520_003891 [Penicillium odoratum]
MAFEGRLRGAGQAPLIAMFFGYNKILIIGATSGIGKALADKLIVSGRRQENLDKLVQKYGSDQGCSAPFHSRAAHSVARWSGNVKLLEIYPPAVQTELHDAKHQPDLRDGHLIGMPLQEFVDEVWERLVEGKE